MNDLADDLISLLQNLTLYLETITAIFASVFYYKYRESYLKYFLLFSWYTVINECLGKFILQVLELNNHIIYNVYLLIFFTYFLSVYSHFLLKKKFKICVKYFIIIYLITFIIGMFYENYFTQFQLRSYIIGSSVLIVSIIFYFIEILNSEKVLYVKQDLLVWISVGLLMFNIVTIPYIVTSNIFGDKVANFNYLNLLFNCTIIFLYLSYTLGFVLSNKIEGKK